MEGEGRGKGSGSSLRGRSTKRRSSSSDFSSPDQLEGGSSSSSSSNTSSFNGVTPGVGGTAGASFMLADSASAAERTREIHGRRTRQRTTRRRENLVSSTPTAPEQMGPHPGDQMNPQQQGLINSFSMPIEDSPLQENPAPIRGQIIIIPDSAMEGGVPQVGDPRIRTRLTSELRNLMGLQDRGGVLQYHSHYRVPGHWWMVGVVYHPDDDEEEDDDDDATVENMSYEELFILGERLATASEGSGCGSTGLSEELIMAKMEQRKYIPSTTTSPVNVELCCICQEEYADSDDIGKLDCRHEFHVACIKEWLAQKNSCPICKSTALAT